jgi:trehalose utilization protein
MINVLIWHEHRHEKTNKLVARLYPEGMHGAIKNAFKGDKGVSVGHALLDDDDEHGLSQSRLDKTDVLIWWGHAAHGDVKDEIVERVAKRVYEGMGLIVLHSGHYSKIFKHLMGTPCSLKWREAGEQELVWIINPNHPIAAGLPECIKIEQEEMYGEPFSIPEPLETVMISHFEGGEVFRSGVTYQRGAGRIFYFRPGHEAYRAYHHPDVLRVIRNAAHWAYNPAKPWAGIHPAPNVPADKAPYPLEIKGERLHADGEEGYR